MKARLRQTPATARQAPTRRAFLKSSGLLVASVAAISVEGVEAFLQKPAAGPYPDRDYLQLDSWIVIRADNTATFYVGKTDLGQGTGSTTARPA